MNLANSIYCCRIRRNRESHAGFAMFLTRKGNVRSMNGISSYKIKNFGVFFTGWTESPAPRRHVVKEILDLEAVSAMAPLRIPGLFVVEILTVIWVPWRPAVGLGSADWLGFGDTSLPSEYCARHAQLESVVLVVTAKCAMCDMLASASPLNP